MLSAALSVADGRLLVVEAEAIPLEFFEQAPDMSRFEVRGRLGWHRAPIARPRDGGETGRDGRGFSGPRRPLRREQE